MDPSPHIIQGGSMLNFNTLLFFLVLLLSVNYTLAQSQTLITDDGREILLKEDGSWEFLSNDRFVTTQDGKRIRLKADGSWEVIDNVPPIIIEDRLANKIELNLQKVVEEQVVKKIQKNVRVSSRMVFYVDVKSMHSETIALMENSSQLVTVLDSLDNEYSVRSLEPAKISIEPNSIHEIEVYVDGAPSPFTSAKTISIVFAPELFNTNDVQKLSYRIADIEEKEVSRFE